MEERSPEIPTHVAGEIELYVNQDVSTTMGRKFPDLRLRSLKKILTSKSLGKLGDARFTSYPTRVIAELNLIFARSSGRERKRNPSNDKLNLEKNKRNDE